LPVGGGSSCETNSGVVKLGGAILRFELAGACAPLAAKTE
jgi:hypothetical protein